MRIDPDRVRQWTEWLVERKSIVNTQGEAEITVQLYEEVKKWAYFQRYPKRIWLQSTGESNCQRYNLIALVRAEADEADTTLLIGHVDTVGTDDYGPLQEKATKPWQLKEMLLSQQVPDEVKGHLGDSDWMFGRGTLDMKSGLAANLSILQYYSEHTSKLGGNLILVAECDEEDSSNGILAAVPFLNQLAKQEKLSIRAAINTDFVTARYQGDPHRYIYAGTVGKLLPSFFVAGKETHVGQAFDGFDPNLVLAELTREIDYNPSLCDQMYGEVTPPPVSLKQTDLKPYYDVQTPLAAFAYYNYLVVSQSPLQVMEIMKECAIRAFERAIETYAARYQSYCERTGSTPQPVTLKPRVYTYAEYVEYLRTEHGDKVEQVLNRKREELAAADLDIRFYCCRQVEELRRLDRNEDPVCVLFYSSLYSPRIALSADDPDDSRLLQAVEHAVEQVQQMYPHPIVVRPFFPYISDMSFVKLSDDDQGIDGYKANMPAWGNRHHVPFDEIRQLNVPIVNIGPYGYDAHKKWGRVELTYAERIVPMLIEHVLRSLWHS
ncbi:M20/M25/M40 family metallo-hydrolase [Brevibacillus humidisoli]|uniref:M20/M25/M40 family metallo-hydrolase n=1 Tax=Brevibacillus humidisoli TaxID=2895522 RepID=UPI001E4E6111|nr:M20/M25/M40 family metallo-hydrolase [Brevibacillus humidisoli]UFJ41615.1 M20/M25/M40 family metallo-hydrolase [Brevibacillus humidisoli]